MHDFWFPKNFLSTEENYVMFVEPVVSCNFCFILAIWLLLLTKTNTYIFIFKYLNILFYF